MGEWYTVQSGDCLSLIGQRNKIPWKKIWEHGENKELRDKRGDPNVLHVGDRLFIPDREERVEDKGTDQKHPFKKPSGLEVRIAVLDLFHEPMPGVAYHFAIDGKDMPEEHTAADGIASVKLRSAESSVVLHLPWGRFPLEMGVLDPARTIRGIQQRLRNLGFDPGPIDGIMGPKTSAGILQFQRTAELPPTGQPDEGTIKELRELHDQRTLGGDHNVLEVHEPGPAACMPAHEIDPVCEVEPETGDDVGATDTDVFEVTEKFNKDFKTVRRHTWGKDNPDYTKMEHDWDYDTVVIHHSGNSGKRNPEEVEQLHMTTNKWDDVGYHFMVAQDGKVYEGRRLYLKGSHAPPNTGRLGILVMGDFQHQIWDDDDDPTKAQIDTTVNLINGLRGIFPDLATLGGHRDFAEAGRQCPGDVLYNMLGDMRKRTGLAAP